MNSLRTDDILGAKPRVRHMPMNLIRERKVPTSFLTNMDTVNPEWNQGASNTSFDHRIQYQNNDTDASPFYSRNRLSKQAKYVNYDFETNHHSDRNDRYETTKPKESSVMKDSKINRSVSVSDNNGNNNDFGINNKIGILETNKSQMLSNRKMSESERGEKSERQSVDSRRSKFNRQQGQQRQREEARKQIFRGLGFNIITNHKYEYSFYYKQQNQMKDI